MALPKGPPEIMNWLLDFPAEPERSLGLELANMLATEQRDGTTLSDSVNQVLRMLDKRVEEATPLYGFDDNGELEQKEIVPGAEAVRAAGAHRRRGHDRVVLRQHVGDAGGLPVLSGS